MTSVTTTRRPSTLTVAAIILGLLSLVSLATPLLAATGGLPLAIIIVGIVFGVVGLAATVGLWLRRRWAAWVGGVVTVLNALSATPGLTAAPTSALRIGVTISLLGAALIIVLLLLPSSRHAYR